MNISSLAVLPALRSLRGPIKFLRENALRIALACLVNANVGLAAELTHEEYAFKAYNRIVGVPPTTAELAEMTKLLKEGKTDEALNIAIESNNFYDSRLVMWTKKWFNEDATNRGTLNDGVATVVGMVRDNIPFNQLLSGNFVYIGNPALIPGTIPAAALDNNNHYQQLETSGLSLKDVLAKATQQDTYNFPADGEGPAGLYTTRGWAAAYYIAGTNRAAFANTMKHFMCKEMEDLHDNTIPTEYIARDVTREPAGNPANFYNTCQGCHAGMDAQRNAWIHFDYDGDDENNGIFLTNVPVGDVNNANRGANNDPHKYHVNNDSFPDGRPSRDNNWINLWAQGQNSSLGWRGATSGSGPKEFGEMITRSAQFSSCMTEQVFELICFHKPTSAEEKEAARNISFRFEAQGSYNIKQVFRDTTKFCINR